jgi:hypothetical protein
MAASSREATISVTELVTQLDCKLPSNCVGDSHDSYAKQCKAAWFWNTRALGYADRVKLRNVESLRRFINIPKIDYFDTSFPSAGEKETPSESMCPTSAAVKRAGAGK